MPSNSKEYQRQYRQKNKVKQSFVTVSMSPEEHDEIRSYAKTQGFSASTLLREATLHVLRGTQMRSRGIEEELQQLRFEVSAIGNNLNQLAHHSNKIKHVADDEAVLRLFKDFHDLAQKLADTRLKEKI